MPFTGSVLIIEKSSPNGLEITTVFLYSESSESFNLSNTLGLSNEYVIACEKPQNCAISLATFSTLCLNDILPIVEEPDGSVVGILAYPKNLATSSAISAVLKRSCLNVGIISSSASLSYTNSSLSKYDIISSTDTSVPKRALIFSGSNLILTFSFFFFPLLSHPGGEPRLSSRMAFCVVCRFLSNEFFCIICQFLL